VTGEVSLTLLVSGAEPSADLVMGDIEVHQVDDTHDDSPWGRLFVELHRELQTIEMTPGRSPGSRDSDHCGGGRCRGQPFGRLVHSFSPHRQRGPRGQVASIALALIIIRHQYEDLMDDEMLSHHERRTPWNPSRR
jgi:hypothetical protein